MSNQELATRLQSLMAQAEDFDALMVLGAVVGAIKNECLEELSEICQEFTARKVEEMESKEK